MASEKRGVWDIRADKINRLFQELDVMMLGRSAAPPTAGLVSGIMARRALSSKHPDAHIQDETTETEHERGGPTPG